jgi:hypothetical protein
LKFEQVVDSKNNKYFIEFNIDDIRDSLESKNLYLEYEENIIGQVKNIDLKINKNFKIK